MGISFREKELFMKIFLTGASGFLGINFLKKIIGNKNIDRIYCLCRSKLSVDDEKIIWIKSDINKINELEINDNIDVVINFAAFLKYESMKMFEAVNVKGTEKTIYFCKKNEIKRIIHCSTINVKLKNKGGYAITKLQAEKLIENSGLGYIIVRPALIYGPQDKGLNKMITSAKKFGCIPVFGNGKYLQQPIYINELVCFFEKIIFCDLESIVLELGGEEQLTYIDIINCIEKILDKKVYLIKIPTKILLVVLTIIEFFRIPFVLRREQIYQITEDLVCQNEIKTSDFRVNQYRFEENLRKYI